MHLRITMRKIILTLLAVGAFSPLWALAHPGRTASDGCHYCRTNCDSWGETYNARHCHGGGTSYSSPSGFWSTAITSTSLRRGSSGDKVTSLQTALATDISIYPEGLITGSFGPLTEQAVKRFQIKYGIDPVGQVGPITKAKINEIFDINL